MALTRLGLDGDGVRRRASFSGGDTPRPGGLFTRCALDGYGARRCGNFSGRGVVTPETRVYPTIYVVAATSADLTVVTRS